MQTELSRRISRDCSDRLAKACFSCTTPKDPGKGFAACPDPSRRSDNQCGSITI
jgi:hypothetical protein